MLRSVKRHLPKIGCPLTVRATSHGAHLGWYELVVTGKLGKLVLRGCSWGYNGEGCGATVDILKELGIPEHEAKTIVATTSNNDVGTPQGRNRTFFKLHLLPKPVVFSGLLPN